MRIDSLKMLEFQAVVMAGGRGSRLPDVPGAPPKCLFPVGPYPLIWYTLNLLERQGFQDVTVVVLESDKALIQNAVEKCALKIKIEYLPIPSDNDWGTADSLRHIQDRIVTDFIVMSCDLVTDSDLHAVLDIFRKHDASAVSLFFDNGPQEYIQVPGPKSKEKPERDLVGIDAETRRLVFLASASDFDDNVDLPKVLLKKHPVLTMKSRLLDSHVYVFKKWVIDFLLEEKHFTTVKGELLPYIVKKQLSKPATLIDNKNVSVAHMDTHKDIFAFATQRKFNDEIRKASTYNDHVSGMTGCYHDDLIRCYSYIPPNTSYAIRVNTLSAYCLINSKIINQWENITKGSSLTKFHSTSDVKTKQIDDQSTVGELTVVSEKTSIKSTIMGSHCTIENKVRLTNCILMDNVTIKEGCILQDCIIYTGGVVEADCSLSLCIVGPRHTVTTKTSAQQQIYSETSDRMITLG